jgi:hypothetical protein
MPSEYQSGSSQTYHCEYCRVVQTKDERTLKAILRGIRTKEQLQDWLHALNKQEKQSELKRLATEQV